MNKHGLIDYLEFPASDLARVEAFYAQVFCWTFQSYGPDYLAFNDGRLDGGFYRSDKCSRTENGAALAVFRTDDLPATEAAVVQAGGIVVVPAFDFPGGRRFHFTDPVGNELAVWCVTEESAA